MSRWPEDYQDVIKQKGVFGAVKTRLNQRRESVVISGDGLAPVYGRLLSWIETGDFDQLGKDPVALWILDMTIEELCPDLKFTIG